MRISWSTLLRILFTLGLTALGVLFFRSTHGELRAGLTAIQNARGSYIFLALLVTAFTVIAQARTMQLCYRSLHHEVALWTCVKLYLKRFFLSPFIPGGFSVAQYTLNSDLAHHNIPTSENAFVSTVYVLGGIVSYIVILIPTFIIAVYAGTIQSSHFFSGLLILAALVIILGLILYVFRREILGRIRAWLHPHVGHFEVRPIIHAFLTSVFVDVLGILILWLSLRAVGIYVNGETAALGYIVTILIITISPLFQGLVVVEGALVYTLKDLGVAAGPAFAGAIVFRTFQLWIPLIAGGIVYIVPIALRWLKSGHQRIVGN